MCTVHTHYMCVFQVIKKGDDNKSEQFRGLFRKYKRGKTIHKYDIHDGMEDDLEI